MISEVILRRIRMLHDCEMILQRIRMLHDSFLNWDDTKNITAYWRVDNGGKLYRGFCLWVVGNGQIRKHAVKPFSTCDTE
jgi:hypothetical protein